MSAADKLRALDDLSTYPSGVIARSDAVHARGRLLLDALPALVAVVEAAEETDALYEQWRHAPGGDSTLDAVREVLECVYRQRLSLATLDEALGGEE